MPPIAWACCVAGGALLGAALLYLYMIKPARRVEMTKYGKKFAHRGLWDAESPENSLAAFRRAVDAGYGIEFDIHKTLDNQVVVFHDDTLTRMCGVEGRVEQKTLAELKELRLLGTDERIPTLEELLSLVDGRVPLLVELKGEDTCNALCPVADAILSQYKGDYIVESFNPLLLRWYKKHRPDVVRGQLFCNLNNGKKLKKLIYYLITALLTNVLARPHFLARGQDSARNPSFLICKNLFRAPVLVWTIRAQTEIPKGDEGIIFEGFIPKE